MDWSSLGSKIASVGAKALGEAIPIPGAGILADTVASTFDTSKDPDAISKAIDADPEAAVKLQRIQQEHKRDLARIQADMKVGMAQETTERQGMVNESLQVEAKQGVLWRRVVGWAFALSLVLTVIGTFSMAGAALYLGKADLLKAIPAVVSALAPVWYMTGLVLGVAGHQEGKLSRALAGDTEGGLSKAIKAVKG